MSQYQSFDIFVLGLKDPSKAGRARFSSTMERLTGRPRDEFQDSFPSSILPVFESLEQEKAQKTVDTLGSSGVFVEIRPSTAPPAEEEMEAGTRRCPACDAVQPSTALECTQCGVVFKKYEREQLARMQRDHMLEQAMVKAMQVREEWLERAKKYLENRPLDQAAVKDFQGALLQDELPFLRLDSEEGPLLLTSRRLISKSADGTFLSMPYEMIADVDFGGGAIQTKKSKNRMQLTFHTAIPVPPDQTLPKAAWYLDKESMFFKEVVMDWGFARNFICGSCGERELDYRTENQKAFCRCMHCATDHEIDFVEGLAVPDL